MNKIRKKEKNKTFFQISQVLLGCFGIIQTAKQGGKEHERY